MHARWLLAALTAAAMASGAWARDLTIVAAAQPGQTLAQDEGRAVLVSEGKAAVVALMIERAQFRDQDRPLFQLAVENRTAAPLAVTEAEIAVSLNEGKARVMSVNDLEKEARRAGDRIRRAAAVDDPYSGNSYGSMGPTGRPMAGSSGAYVGASGGASSDLGRTARASGEGADVEAELMLEARAIGFKRLTVPPGQRAFTGLPLSTLPRKAVQVDLTVSLGGETHAFRFQVAPVAR